MNDRYIFRVWDKDETVMISPDYISRDGIAYWKRHSIPESSDLIMQATGLRDKTRTKEHPKGRLGFEGDIVKKIYKEYPMFVDGWGRDLKLTRENAEAILNAPKYTLRTDIYIIDFDRGEFYLKRHPCYGRFGIYELDKSEIIGNIYEDPELLNKSKA